MANYIYKKDYGHQKTDTTEIAIQFTVVNVKIYPRAVFLNKLFMRGNMFYTACGTWQIVYGFLVNLFEVHERKYP